jgi:L-fuconolactonase
MILPPDQLHAIDCIAGQHANLRIIIDHLTIASSRRDDDAFAKLKDLYPLVRHPDVVANASRLSNYTTNSYPFRAIHGHMERVIETFGPNCVFWGTDIAQLRCSYQYAKTYFTEELPSLSEADKKVLSWVKGFAIGSASHVDCI